MPTFESIVQELPNYLSQLLQQKANSLKDLTEGKIKRLLGTDSDIPGIYLIYNQEKPVYIGRSAHLAQRVGKDHRALEETQATLTYRLVRSGLPEITSMKQARDYMFRNFKVKILPVNDEYMRTIFEVYASLKLNTPYNKFMEH